MMTGRNLIRLRTQVALAESVAKIAARAQDHNLKAHSVETTSFRWLFCKA